MQTVVLISSAYALESGVDPDVDLAFLVPELEVRNVAVRVIDWRKDAVDWSSVDLAIVKSPWDYTLHADEFHDWLTRVASQTHVLNPLSVIEWNMNKRYLGQLAERGVSVCPSRYATDLDAVREAIAATDAPRIVVKPTVSAGSQDTGLFDVDDPGAVTLAERILGLGKTVLVQPAIAAVAEEGERSLIFFGGEFVHAIRKGPLLALGGGLLTGGEYVESIDAAVATEQEQALAAQALAAAAEITGESFLYARVDIARGDEGPLLMELELVEPSYFLNYAPIDASTRYVNAVERFLSQRASTS